MTSNTPVSFHVRHNVLPDRLLETLWRIDRNAPIDGIVEGDRQIYRAVSLGLVVAEKGPLTPLGATVLKAVSARPNLWGELGHYMHYSVWNAQDPERNGFGYLYRLFCNFLFENQIVEVGAKQTKSDGSFDTPRDKLQRVCVQLSNSIEAEPIFEGRIEKGISLSPDSLTGVLKWLEVLQPPVIEDGQFARRSFCSPELLLLAIGFVMRDEPDALGVDILLSHSRREDICRVCMLAPSAFDQTLDWMIPTFPKVIVSTEEAGYYGRYIRLLKRPELEDIVR